MTFRFFLPFLLGISLLACQSGEVSHQSRPVPIADLLDKPIELTLNPNSICPLAARASIQTQQATQVAVEVLGPQPVAHQFTTFQEEHEIPILGLYPGQENTILIHLEGIDGAYATDTLSLTTLSIPAYFPEITIEQQDTSRMEPGFHLADLHFAAHGKFLSRPLIFDANGVVRWYMDLSFLDAMAIPAKRIRNGNWAFGSKLNLYEYDMLGQQLHHWPIGDNYAHHDLLELPNGNWIVPVGRLGAMIFNGTEEVPSHNDFLIEFDPEKGTVIHEWDLRQILDVQRYDIQDGTDGHWIHVNAVEYSEKDHTLIVSARNQGVIKIDWNNQLQWILAPHKNWGKAGPNSQGPETAPFLLTAVDETGSPFPKEIQMGEIGHPDFDWPWGQHANMLLENGDIFLFDNGTSRYYINQPNFSRAVRYRVDEEAQTVQQIWQYGKERGEELFSLIISDVDILPQTGNSLITFGHCLFNGEHYGKIVELNFPQKEELFEAKIRYKDQEGNGQFGWGQFDIMYRAERISLYP